MGGLLIQAQPEFLRQVSWLMLTVLYPGLVRMDGVDGGYSAKFSYRSFPSGEDLFLQGSSQPKQPAAIGPGRVRLPSKRRLASFRSQTRQSHRIRIATDWKKGRTNSCGNNVLDLVGLPSLSSATISTRNNAVRTRPSFATTRIQARKNGFTRITIGFMKEPPAPVHAPRLRSRKVRSTRWEPMGGSSLWMQQPERYFGRVTSSPTETVSRKKTIQFPFGDSPHHHWWSKDS